MSGTVVQFRRRGAHRPERIAEPILVKIDAARAGLQRHRARNLDDAVSVAEILWFHRESTTATIPMPAVSGDEPEPDPGLYHLTRIGSRADLRRAA